MNKLKILREARGLSQEFLGRELNLTARRIGTYEAGEAEPDIGTLKSLAEYFGVTVDYLLEEENNLELIRPEYSLARFGQRLKENRIDKGISPEVIAEASDITRDYYLLIENGAKIPSLETSVKILNALQMSADKALMDCLVGAYSTRARFLDMKMSELHIADQKLLLDIIESTIKTLKENEVTK